MIRIHPRPDIDSDDVLTAVRDHHGLDGSLTPLPGERDLNFRLDTRDGGRFVVKVSSPSDPDEILEVETRLLAHLHEATGGLVTGVRRSASGQGLVHHVDRTGTAHRIRVVDYLPGEVLAQVRPRSRPLLRDLGRCVAHLDQALGAFPDHPPARLDFDWALGMAGDVMTRGLELLSGHERTLVEGSLRAFRGHESRFLGLGSQMIHGDLNDHNILVSPVTAGERHITGIIDLGDAHSAPRVFDLAIAVAYAIFDTPDPLMAAAAIVSGYHEAFPLLSEEVDVLVPLVRARLGQSVCFAAWRRRGGSAGAVAVDDYLTVSERPAWAMLEALASVPEALARGAMRHSCGLDACPRSGALRSWLADRDFHPVMDAPQEAGAVTVLDLSVASLDLTGRDTDDTEDFTRRVFARMDSAGAALGIGRYLEPRAFYLSDAFAGRPGDPTERRTIHLGLDVFARPGAEVRSPLAGTVRSVQDNNARLDYGPTVILEHEGPAGPFWTLYGHLERTSVTDLVAGTQLEAGAHIARVGPHPENGDWPPHLHFQILTDLLGFEGEFPGVALPRESDLWASFCPDPNLILRLPGQTTYQAQNDLTARRGAVLGRSLSVAYPDPIHAVRGRGQFLYDVLGREYLDCVNNVAHVGHEHPRVVRAGQQQMAVLNTNTRYLHESVLAYAERLGATFPDPLSVCFFVNSGSEANELALRMARAHTGRTGVVALEGGYHGNTQGLVDISHYKLAGPGGGPPPHWVRFAAMPDEYRGPHRRGDPARASLYAARVRTALAELHAVGTPAAAFMAECILSCGGQIEPPRGYVAEAYAHARAAGAVCIADEVQIGFGRVGTHMWGFQSQEVLPDIVTLGKPIGNGHPMGAVVTTPAIAESFANGMEFFSTFGGNPVSAEIGLAVLDVVADEGLQANAQIVGSALKADLSALGMRHPIIGDVRGRGLFLGIEFVQDRAAATPCAQAAAYVSSRMKERGILLSTDGPDHNVIKFKPPMPFSERDAARLVDELDGVLGEDVPRSLARAASD